MAELAGAKSSVSIDANIEQNILDKFDLPTYHIRYFMMSDRAIRANDFGPNSRLERIVIAESGVTSLEIDDLEIHTVAGISREAGIGTATNFSFTITEPYGAQLLDNIADAANRLGIENFTKAPFFLEVSFRGRDSGDLSSMLPGTDNELRGLVWVWPIIMTKMAMNVNVGGSTYALEAAIYGDLAYTNQASDIEKSMIVTASTVGEFFTGFEEQLNSRESEKVELSGYKKVDTYKFFIDEKIINEKIIPDRIGEQQNRAATMNETKNGKVEFTFQPGTSIDRVVESILSLTAFFQKEVKGTDDKDTQGDDKKGEDAIFQTLYRLLADTKMGPYDSGRLDYQRTYRYLIIPYQMTTVQTLSNEASTQSDDQRYQAIKSKGLVRKIYDYIYTGLNDQVLDFDLTFNFNWYAALPLQGGKSTNVAAAEVKAVTTEEQKEKSKTSAVIVSDVPGTFDSDTASFTPVLSDLDLLLGTVTNQITPASLEAADVIGAAISETDAALDTNILGIESSFSPVPGVAGGGNSRLVSRLLAGAKENRVKADDSSKDLAQQNLQNVDPKLEDSTSGERKTLVLTSYIESHPTQGSSSGSGALVASSGQTMLSAMFEQAESPVSADLLNIDLKIKGDPYWLEPAPTLLNVAPLSRLDRALAKRGIDPTVGGPAVEVVAPLVESDVTTADTSESQTYIIFRSFTPKQFDAETGLTAPGNANNVLNGIYAVRTVTHSFSGGRFTQDLHAIRDPKITLKNVDLRFISGNEIREAGGVNNAVTTETVAEETREEVVGVEKTPGEG